MVFQYYEVTVWLLIPGLVSKNVFTAFGVNEAERAFAAISMLNRGIGEERVFAMTGANAATVAYVRSLGVASISELSFSELVKLGTLNLKANTKQILANAAAWATSPLGMATIAAASIFLIVKAVDWLTVSLEESREALANLKEEYNNNEGELTTLNDELQTTIDRINELQSKDSLTFTEAEELENLQRQNSELKTQIALLETIQKQKNREINKTFVETMDKDLGNKKEFATHYKYASSNYTPQFGTGSVSAGGLTTRTMSEMDLLNSALVRRNEIYNELQKASGKNREKLQEDLEEIESYLVSKSQEFLDASEGISYISNPSTDDEKKVNEWLAFIKDFNDKMMIAFGTDGAKENAFNRLIHNDFSDATEELKELVKQGQVTAEHLKDPKYDEFIAKCIDLGIITEENEEGLAFLALGFNTLSSAESNAASSTALVTSAIERMEKALEQLNKVADNGQSSISSLSDAMTKLHNGALTVSEVIDLIQDFPELAPFVDLDADGYGNLHEGLLEMVKKTAQETKEELLALQISGDLSEEAARSIDVLCEAIDQMANDALNNVAPKIDSFVGSLSKLQKSASGLDLLGGIYADVADGETFDWTAILNNEDFTEQFGGLGDAYSNFIKTVSTSNGDLKACQSAFDALTTAYIMNSGALDEVTTETRAASIALLEEKGIANAAALVDAKLAGNLVYLSEQTKTYVSTLLAEEQVLWDECEAGSTAAQSLANLVQQKLAFNSSSLNTANDIHQLMKMAEYANATAASIQRLAKAEEFMAQYYAMKDKSYSFAVTFLHQANALLSKPIEYESIEYKNIEASVKFSGGSEYLNKLKKENSKEESWFEKEYALHQHLLQMDAENVDDYLKWLNEAYQRAYREGVIDLNEYYKYQEEVYTGLQEVFKDHLNDIEHEISMRENYDGEAKKIIQLYEGLIESVENEIATARAKGLTDEDDYIQELQKKWQDYTGSITNLRTEITDSAKDALGDLVDYRIDMLKEETSDEKDALDKRLDNLKDFYDKQKELLQDQRDEEKYLKDQTDKRKTIMDLRTELSMLEHDDSAWAQKRKLELKEEIVTAQEDLDEYEKDHALDLALDALDKAYNDQESQLQAEMNALEERLNDPEALYNKALEDIRKNSENQLYYQMLMYNRQFGDGNDETINALWESAFGALLDYEKLFGELYEGVRLGNETGVATEGGWDNETISDTDLGSQRPANKPGPENPAQTKPENKAPSLIKGSSVQVKRSATHFGSKSDGVRMESFVPGGTYTAYQTSDNQVLIGRDGVYTGWINMSDIVGYAGGTSNATAGLHKVDELGTEYIFESPSDGARYRMFHGGEKVLTAEATDFLYKFASTGGGYLTKILTDLLGSSGLGTISRPMQKIEVHSGDIIVQGNASERTVSEIRRAQRDNLEFVLKSLNSLNK